MSRNIKNIMASLFEDMLLYSLEFDDQVYDESIDYPRWIYGDSEDARLLASAKIINGPITYVSNKKAAILEYRGTKYFVLSSTQRITDIPYFMVETIPSSGLSTLAIYGLSLPIKSNLESGYIYNNIASQHIHNTDYKGHDINDVRAVYDDFYVYSIDVNSPLRSHDLYRSIGAVLCNNLTNLTLKFEKNTVEQFYNTFVFGAKNIPFDNLLASILSTTYRHSFVELYQCLEKLYQVFYSESLYNLLNIKITFIEFLRNLDENLSWRPNESGSIDKMFSATPSYVFADISNLKYIRTGSFRNPSSWLYSIRNNIVHLSPLQEKLTFSNKEWNIILLGLLKIIEFWYYRFDSLLDN